MSVMRTWEVLTRIFALLVKSIFGGLRKADLIQS